jgi:hypothetical protein
MRRKESVIIELAVINLHLPSCGAGWAEYTINLYSSKTSTSLSEDCCCCIVRWSASDNE